MEFNVLERINDDGFVVRISPEIQSLVMNRRDSVVLNFNGNNFVISEYSEDLSSFEGRPADTFDNYALSRRILRDTAVPTPSAIASTSRITQDLSRSILGKVPLDAKEYIKIYNDSPIISTKSIRLEDIDLTEDQFASKVFIMFQSIQEKFGNAENYFLKKISPSPQLRVDREIPSNFRKWWEKADWRRKLFLLSSPKESNGLVIANTSQMWIVKPNLTQDQFDRLVELIESVPFFRTSDYSSDQ